MNKTCLLMMILGATVPGSAREVVRFDNDEWNRKQNREEIALIHGGQVDRAVANMLSALEAGGRGHDPELMYGLALAYSMKGDSSRAFDFFERAIRHGLPAARFLAGPRHFEALYRHPGFLEMMKPAAAKPVHGPMLGAVTGESCQIWLRTWGDSRVRIDLFSDPGLLHRVVSQERKTADARDYTAVFHFEKLSPQSSYWYKIFINDDEVDSVWSFRTFPATDQPGLLTIGFGGGAAYNPEYERIWDTIAGHDLDVFFGLGDNVYIDHPELPAVQRFCYYQRQSVPEFRRLVSRTPYIGIWDDHDFGDNDSWGGPAKDEPRWKLDVLDVFRENFANPGFASDDLPGVWFDYRVGGVHFLFLDCRYYRQPSTDPAPSMLGPDQMKWLKTRLRASTASFKVIVSSVPWADDAKGLMAGRIDTWGGYPGERGEIFSFLTENEISGVLLLSADRHRHDVWKHPRKNDYPLYEFSSSRLTNIHYHPIMPGSLFGYNEKNGFGKIIFNTLAEQPHLVHQLYTIDNELIHQIRVYLHQMMSR